MTQPTLSQLHSYMLEKTREYYAAPPEVLIQDVIDAHKKEGETLTHDQARQLVTPLAIQRLIKDEMQQKWPELMAAIPSNPLRTHGE